MNTAILVAVGVAVVMAVSFAATWLHLSRPARAVDGQRRQMPQIAPGASAANPAMMEAGRRAPSL